MNTLKKHLRTIIIALFSILAARSAFTHDIWYIDSQSVSWTCATEADFSRISYFRLDENRWQRSDAAEFYETHSPEIPLVIFVPGYSATPADIVEEGMKLSALCAQKNIPCRMVFWGWPARRVYTPLPEDIRAKLPVTAASARYLAMFLRRLPPGSSVSMFGFSFGARIICDAVELLRNSCPPEIRIRLVLAAPASDRNWLGEHCRHADVPKIAEKTLILCNANDRALRFYPRLYADGSRPEALGRLGPHYCTISPEFRSKIETVDVGPYVGGQHRTLPYMDTPPFRRRMGTYLLFADR